MTPPSPVPGDLLTLAIAREHNGHVPHFEPVGAFEIITNAGRPLRLEKSLCILSPGDHIRIRAVAFTAYDAATDTVFYYVRPEPVVLKPVTS